MQHAAPRGPPALPPRGGAGRVIPLRDVNPSATVPIVTRTLILINVVAFLYEFSLGPDLRAFMLAWGFVPARLSYSLHVGGEPLPGVALTVLSSMFLHGGWAHLIGNMWYLWIFGDNVEDRLGHFGYLVFYLVAGAIAALVQYATQPDAQLPTVGASGAIAGVLGAYAVAFPRARVITLVPLLIFFQVLPLPALLVLGLWFVYQFLFGALSLSASGVSGGIAFWAHIGGFAFGAVAMLLLGGRTRRAVEG